MKILERLNMRYKTDTLLYSSLVEEKERLNYSLISLNEKIKRDKLSFLIAFNHLETTYDDFHSLGKEKVVLREFLNHHRLYKIKKIGINIAPFSENDKRTSIYAYEETKRHNIQYISHYIKLPSYLTNKNPKRQEEINTMIVELVKIYLDESEYTLKAHGIENFVVIEAQPFYDKLVKKVLTNHFHCDSEADDLFYSKEEKKNIIDRLEEVNYLLDNKLYLDDKKLAPIDYDKIFENANKLLEKDVQYG